MPGQEVRSLHQQFLDLNAQAFAGRHFEMAYHALAAAEHAAEELRDAGLIAEVERLAREQEAWIDANARDHRLSSWSARRRGGQGVFASLSGQAHSALLGLKVEGQAAWLRQINETAPPGDRDRVE